MKRLTIAAVVLFTCACTPEIRRVGPPLASSAGTPESSCEKRRFMELAPVEGVSRNTIGIMGGSYRVSPTTYVQEYATMTYTAEVQGTAFFWAEGDSALDVRDVAGRIDSPLLAEHDAGVSIRAMNVLSHVLMWGGLVAAGATFADGIENGMNGAAMGITLGTTLVGLIVHVALSDALPGARLSRYVVTDEAERAEAEAALTRYNAAQRLTCQADD